mmetsp:Transcript_18975/g.34370  ORF Transcript_18975/g.34370 Transcript_18975/m.34370 type:complete len:160 (-) Transcript_18975:157-636(-)
MSWNFFLWLFTFFLQAGLLGRSIYGLMLLTDLENDFINPYDYTKKNNSFWWIDFGGQCLITSILVLSGKWLIGSIHVVLLAGMVYWLLNGDLIVQATDVIKKLKSIKKYCYIVFSVYAIFFVICLYKMVDTIVVDLLAPEGRQAAKKLLKEAVAAHGFF